MPSGPRTPLRSTVRGLSRPEQAHSVASRSGVIQRSTLCDREGEAHRAPWCEQQRPIDAEVLEVASGDAGFPFEFFLDLLGQVLPAPRLRLEDGLMPALEDAEADVEVLHQEIPRDDGIQRGAHGVAGPEGPHHAAPIDAFVVFDGVLVGDVKLFLGGDALDVHAAVQDVGADLSDFRAFEVLDQLVEGVAFKQDVGVGEDEDIVRPMVCRAAGPPSAC